MRTIRIVIFFFCMYASLVFASGVDLNFSFILFGDNRPNKYSGVAQSEIFKKMIQDINYHKDEVAFAVSLGDIIDGNSDMQIYQLQLNEYLKCIKELKVPLHHVPGNHEIRKSPKNETIYKEIIGETYYSFEYEGCLFVILDTEEIGHEGNIEGDQLLWLEKELNKDTSIKLIFLHRPFFPVQRKGTMKKENFNKLLSLFKEHKITAIFAGHDHFFNKNIHNGILQVISGGGGAPLYSAPTSGAKIHHFCIVTISGENVQVKVIPVEE